MAYIKIRHLIRQTLQAGLYGTIGAIVTLVTVYILYLNGRADLDLWHLISLDQEFTAASKVSTFEEYLLLEKGVFKQLDDEVYSKLGPAQTDGINRYKRGSLADPERWSPNWNRSFLLPLKKPRAAVLLIHGMSDSPYSLRNMGQRLHAAGAYVLGLRVPGHGTIPSGLIHLKWQDMDAAVRLAVKHLSEHNEGVPIHIVGYSNGAALAVNYTLASLVEPDIPRIESLAILSPEIGLTPVAALAKWQGRLGRLLGLDKLAWNSLQPEYDPFKYGSFAVNAGDVAYRMTLQIQNRITALTDADQLDGIPPILAFSSLIDATVSAPALINGLFNRLSPGEHELVLFDINRNADMDSIFKWTPDAMIEALQKKPERSYTLTLVGNEHPHSAKVLALTRSPGQTTPSEKDLNLFWPKELYSLSHIALPFPPGDPLYGGYPESKSPGIHLGGVALRGERGALRIPAAEMLRLRWNPFYPYLEDKVLAFFSLDAVPVPP